MPMACKEEKVDAIIRVTVPKWQIGEEVSIYFPDTMTARGKCEAMPAQVTIFCENADAKTREELKAEMQKAKLAVFEEKPQGKWIKEYRDFKCSLCGKIAYSWNDHGTYIQIKSDFCPHCGARMVKK